MRNKILAGVIVLGLLAMAVACNAVEATDVGILQADNATMVRWYGECELTTRQLNDAGIQFTELNVGGIDTGQKIEVTQFDNSTALRPVTKQGVAIEFGTLPSAETLAQIDAMLPSCVREGRGDSITPLPDIQELQDRIIELERLVAIQEDRIVALEKAKLP